MSLKTIKSICLGCLALLIIFYSPKIDALSHEWIAVPKSQYGAQLWDKNSIEAHQDRFIRVLSKFIPKSTTEITHDILYTCLLYTSPSPRDLSTSRMPSSA